MGGSVRRTRRHQRHRERVMRAHNGVCHICGEGAADAIDHIVPVSWGGSDDPSNLAPAHTSCNTRKGNAPPPHWTYERPSMWMDGYGPRDRSRSPSHASSQGAGCLSWVSALITGTSVGLIITLFGLGPIVGLIAGALVVWWMVRSAAKRKATVIAPTPSAAGLERPNIQMADGSSVLDARGEPSLGGTAADIAPEGDAMVKVSFTPVGTNVETLIALLDLAGGRTGYRDGLTVLDGGDLVVHAMARLAADVVATGDDDVGAAPVGRIPAEAWQHYPAMGLGVTLVQVALEVERDGQRRGWIIMRESVVSG